MAGKRRRGMSRREFLRFTAAGALALSVAPAFIRSRSAYAYEPGTSIHPNISPLRVVGVRDPAMSQPSPECGVWQQQESLIAWDAVVDNLDRMACVLAEEGDEATAWRKIFLKPAGKAWSDVVVAIKGNYIAQQRTHSAVVSKLCRVFTDVLGVKGENVFVYDACHGRGMAKSTPFTGLPDGVHLAEQWGGFNVEVPMPEPYLAGQARSRCLGHLVRGEVDILVDLALCKGHGYEFGGFTMAMKNHFGTFDPRPSHGEGGGADYLIAVNKTPQILGDVDPATGRVLFPRQQLCIIDALWASEPGPSGPPTAQPNALVMGVCAPTLDYVAAMHLRRDIMGWRLNEQVAERFLAEFGFSKSDLQNGGRIVDAQAA